MNELYTTDKRLRDTGLSLSNGDYRRHAVYRPVLYIIERHLSDSVLPIAAPTRSDWVFTSFGAARKALFQLWDAKPSATFPEAIIVCVSSDQKDQAETFYKSVQRYKRIQPVPFILMSTFEEGKPDINALSMYDDVITPGITREDLQRKINFLKKFEMLKSRNASGRDLDDISVSFRERRMAFGKRLVDIVFSAALILILSPVMLLIVLLIKLTSKGPVFYMAERSGTNYKVFKFIKFRSMVVDADKKLEKLKDLNQYKQEGEESVFIKISKDPRITPVGRFLRNTSLDELPQLFNVLKGDMSIVGNRPLPLYEAQELTTDLYAERFIAPAGITGLWQIKKRGQKEMSTVERIALDIIYARKHSFWFDLKILANTPKALIQKDNV